MHELKRRHPWMSDELIRTIGRAALARAAQQFAGAEMWTDAADCHARLGQHEQAAEMFVRAGDLRAAAAACLDGDAFAPALAHYQSWTAQQRPDDMAAQVEGLLGQSACHRLPPLLELDAPGLDAENGRLLYLQARELTEQATPPLVAARCWAAIGAYGDRIDRYDLVHTGYELAWRAYGETTAEAERIEMLRRYLAAVRTWQDRTLTAELELRLAAAERPGEEIPGWWAQRATIESHPFRDGVRDALHFTAQAQWQAWDELAKMEESPEVDDYLRGLAPPEMVYIPPGAFLMGSGDEDPEARDNEKPQHEAWLRGYYIDKYPVTNEQYRAFMEAEGYEKREYWTDAGWNWRGNRREPGYWNDNQKNNPRQPVVGVSWYESLAYTRWAGKALPTEAQWEKAAGWDPEAKTMRRYPWGKEWDERMANIYQPNSWPAVGQICDGARNAYGISDMAGIYTWCTTKWDNSYPYIPDDGREDEAGDATRVLRGGGSRQDWKRCGFRLRFDPGNRDFDRGFRCILPHACAAF